MIFLKTFNDSCQSIDSLNFIVMIHYKFQVHSSHLKILCLNYMLILCKQLKDLVKLQNLLFGVTLQELNGKYFYLNVILMIILKK